MKGSVCKVWYSLKNKRFKIYITTFIMLSIIIFTGCNSSSKEDKKLNTSLEEINFTSALIEKNNNIYLYDDNYTYLEPIGDLTKLKELTTLSEDGKNIAFKYVNDKYKINVYDLTTKEYRVLEIDNNNSSEISSIQWIDNLIVVGLYKNPTTTRYLIYNAEDFQLVNSCEGILIDVMDGGSTLVYGANKQGVTSIYINDTKVYDLQNTGEVLLGGNISSNKKNIAFITFVFDRETFEQKEYLYTAKLGKDEFKSLKVVEKPYEIAGNVNYYGEDLIISDLDTYAEFKDGNFVIKDLKNVNSSIKENTNKLKNILKDTFKTENIDPDSSWSQLGIENITWFTR